MSLTVFLFFGSVAVLLLVLVWSLRDPRKLAKPAVGTAFSEAAGRRHVVFLPQIQQALAKVDADFLLEKGSLALQRRVRRERRRVVLAFLSDIREDFHSLLRLAKIIAMLSPEVAVLQEFERLRLTVMFDLRYRMIRMQLHAGLMPTSWLEGLSGLVSGLSVRIEAAMKELGERAALAAELASSLDGRGADVT